MKRTLFKSFLLVAVLALLCGCAVSAQAARAHTHEWKLAATRKEPTCTEEGTGLYTCSCGEREMQSIPALGHSWGSWKTTKAATCTKAGSQTRTCSRCGAKETKSIAATGHSYEWKTVKKATCGAAGSRQQVCKACGAKGKIETIKATGNHTYEWKVTKKATCGATGSRQQVCKVCGAKGKTETIKATGNHTYEWKVTKKATCGADGSRQQVCKVCGAKGKTETVKATGKHTYEWKVTKKATCGADGSRQQVCKVCGAKGKTETVQATGKHTFGEWKVTKAASCESAGEESRACTVCKKTETRAVPALGHDWDAGVTTKEPGYLNPGETTYTCARCGATKTEEIIPKEFPDSLKDPGNISLMNLDVPLMIVTQPTGGNIDQDGGSMQLSVEAAGGKPPYTYQWRMRYNGWWSWYRDVENGTDSTVEAKHGNYRYYCKVYDSKGTHVASDTVLVDWNLYIAEQPHDANLYGKENVTLQCTAKGGVPFDGGTYIYAWYNSAGEQISFSDQGATEVTMPGEYYCVVEDTTLNCKTSDTCTVYLEKTLTISDVSGTQELDQGEETVISCAISGGRVPYTVTWLEDDAIVFITGGEEDTYTLPVTGNGGNEVIYTVKAVDSRGNEESAKVSVIPKDHSLRITSLNSYEIIDKLGDKVEFHAKVEGGEPPYSYRWRKTQFDPEFERISNMITQSTDFIKNNPYFQVGEPFTTWELTVKDAAGTRITSQSLLVAYDGEFEIVEQPKDVTYNIISKDEHMYTCTMSCKAIGPLGHELQYQWEKKENGGWVKFYPGPTMYYNERQTATTFYYIQDAIFRCRVTDLATGEEAISREAKLTLPKLQVTASSGGTSAFLTIEGGKEPYTVTCSKRQNNVAENWIISEAYSLSPGQVKIKAQGRRWAEVEITGLDRAEKHWDGMSWKYFFTIIDILGNTAEVSVKMLPY